MDLLILVAMGAVAGALAGLLGIGGGIIIVPVLALVFQHRGLDPAVLMHSAIGTSLGTIVFTSISSIRAHQRLGAIDWEAFRRITPGILAGSFLGAMIADFISGTHLRTAFGVFMLLVALQMAFGQTTKPHRQLPGRLGMLLAGTLIGSVAAMMGVGGGSMTVPFLTWCNAHIRTAVATSAAIGLPIALAGASGFVITGWGQAALPPWSIGYINLPAFVGIVFASMALAPVGARLAHRISPILLRRSFAMLLVVLGLRMLLV